MDDHDWWTRFLDLSEQSATPGPPRQKIAERERRSMLMAESAKHPPGHPAPAK